MAITKVALLEHCTISSSKWTIFLIRETGEFVLAVWVSRAEGGWERTGKSALPGDFLGIARVLGWHGGRDLIVNILAEYRQRYG